MPPTDQLRISRFKFPYKLNTMAAPADLQPTEATKLHNVFYNNGQLVRRRGFSRVGNFSTTNNKQIIGAFYLNGYAAIHLQNSVNSLYFQPETYNFFRTPESGTPQQAKVLTAGTEYETVLLNLSTGTLTTFTAGYPHSSFSKRDGGVLYNQHYWTISDSFLVPPATSQYITRVSHLGLDPITNNGDADYTLTATATLGSNSVSYSALSVANANLTNLIFRSGNTDTNGRNRSYRIIQHNPSTATTGTFLLDNPWGTPTITALTSCSAFRQIQHGFNNPGDLGLGPTFAGWGRLVSALGTTVPVKPTCLAVFRDRLFVGTNTGALLWSNPGTFDDANSTNYVQTPLSCITGLIEYQNALYIFGPDKFIRLSGYDEGSFSLSRTVADIGCMEPSALKIFKGSLFIPSYSGIFKYAEGSAPQEISEPIKNLWLDYVRGSSLASTDKSLFTRISVIDILDRFLLISVTNPTRTTGNASKYMLLYDSETNGWSTVSGDTSTGGLTDGTSRIARFFKTTVNDDLGVYGVSAKRVNRIGPAFVAPIIGDQLNSGSPISVPFEGSTGFDEYDTLTNVIPVNVKTGFIELNPEGSARIHESMVEHSTSNPNDSVTANTFATTVPAGNVSFFKDPLPLVPISGVTAILRPISTGAAALLLHPSLLQITQRVLLPESAFDCRYFALSVDFDTASVDVGIALNGFLVRWEPTRQFNITEGSVT